MLQQKSKEKLDGFDLLLLDIMGDRQTMDLHPYSRIFGADSLAEPV